MRAGARPFLLTLLLTLPSTSYQGFDGLPVSLGGEVVGLVLLIPLLAGRARRRLSIVALTAT